MDGIELAAKRAFRASQSAVARSAPPQLAAALASQNMFAPFLQTLVPLGPGGGPGIAGRYPGLGKRFGS